MTQRLARVEAAATPRAGGTEERGGAVRALAIPRFGIVKKEARGGGTTGGCWERLQAKEGGGLASSFTLPPVTGQLLLAKPSWN